MRHAELARRSLADRRPVEVEHQRLSGRSDVTGRLWGSNVNFCCSELPVRVLFAVPEDFIEISWSRRSNHRTYHIASLACCGGRKRTATAIRTTRDSGCSQLTPRAPQGRSAVELPSSNRERHHLQHRGRRPSEAPCLPSLPIGGRCTYPLRVDPIVHIGGERRSSALRRARDGRSSSPFSATRLSTQSATSVSRIPDTSDITPTTAWARWNRQGKATEDLTRQSG